MAKLLKPCLLIVLVSSLVLLGSQVLHAVPYDHRYTDECLGKPDGAQYGGGIVVNPELNEGLKGWTTFGTGSSESSSLKIEHQINAKDGNKFIVASNRDKPFHSFTQKFYLEKDKLYTFSAWLQVSHGNAHIAAIFKLAQGGSNYETAGWVIAKKGCWSMLKGGLLVNASGPAHLYFQSNQSKVDVWADSISLQPFTHKEWSSHQHQNIEKFRKRRLKIQVVDEESRPIANARISIKQTNSKFPLGCAINYNILDNMAYQKWFTSRRFKYTVFENELKWYATEIYRGSKDYSVSDSLVRFAKAHNIAGIRGHNVFWDDPKYQPTWIRHNDQSLSSDELRAAANARIKSVMERYSGKLFFHWDVVNENLHFNFFESKLGWNASSVFYMKANEIDPKAIPFLNEYNTIEESKDEAVSPAKYLQKIREIREAGYDGPLGIGLEGHFSYANLAYIRSCLDTLASAELPIWITELDVDSGPMQAIYLDQIMKELISHPAVQGIMIWGAWSENGCYRMCLTDNNFNNLATGNVVDNIIHQLHNKAYEGEGITTDSDGFFEASVFHGEYEAKIFINNNKSSSAAGFLKFNVVPKEEEEAVHDEGPLYFKMVIN